jgi:hypothetical protein
MASLAAGQAFLIGKPSQGEQGAVWRSEKEGDWQRSDDPGLANLVLASGLQSDGKGLVLFGQERGPSHETSSPALWGSPDGIHWLQTSRLAGQSVLWSTATATTDAWFVYGAEVTVEGQQRRQTVWRTNPRCATAAANCPA